jgi:deoxyribose-phosphate aldolase
MQNTPGNPAKTALSPSELARFIDHTLLKPEATEREIRTLCEEARKFSFATVCINSRFIPLAAELLAGTKTLPIAVVGFPLGACATEAKVFETRWAVEKGAREIDMVVALGALMEGKDAEVEADIRAVVQAAGPSAPVKVILETCLLNDEQKTRACRLSVAAGAAFVKTSTGFSKGGATLEDIRLMRATVGPNVGVKASGGIRTREQALAMIEAGANRIGASASAAIVEGGGVSGSGY